MYAEERQQAIAAIVAARPRMAVVDLASEFRVTTETVRRDLSALERLGLVRRVHGGAVPAGALSAIESDLGERDTTNPGAKDAIAALALTLLPPAGATVLLDAGTTTARLASALPADHAISVWTHAVPIAHRLLSHPHIDLHVLPGRVRQTTQAAVGAATVAALADLRADVAFIGTNGITARHGATTPDSDEADTKRAMVGAAQRVVCLADSSKLGRETAVRFATTEEIDVLITDAGAEARTLAELEDAGVEVLVA